MTTTLFAAVLGGAALLLVPSLAQAEPGFADPPGYREPPNDEIPRSDPPPPFAALDSAGSTFRLCTGPVLRATSERADGGFGAALDIGAKAAGARFAGSWVGVGSNHGLSQYDAQLWLDFGHDQRLHPLLAAGVGLARLESTAATPDSTQTTTLGVGTLRGSLEYVLPIHEADARAGLDIEGALPAIRSQNAPDIGGWLLVGARVGIGF
jgi:hypothetical protein